MITFKFDMKQKRKFHFLVGGLIAVYLIFKAVFIFKPVHIVTSECSYANLRYDNISSSHGGTCAIYKPSPDACREANKYFGNPSDKLPTRTCSPSPSSDICWFTDTFTPKLKCSMFCEDNIVYMARLDLKYGTVRYWQEIAPFTIEKAAKFIHEAQSQGETFCFIKCAGFVRVILFPPKIIFSEDSVDRKRKPNVVIVVLDSISRRHFYRVMRRSVETLREVENRQPGQVAVYDFELFQSVSMHTFDNLRPLFSGVTSGDTNFDKKSSAAQRPLGIDVLFKHYKQHGYQTMLQEDLCWHDEWGTLLDHLETKPDSNPTLQRWARFNEIVSKHQLDHVGITHFTCQVLKPYNQTNLYDHPPKVCLNGRFIHWYFYKYIRSYVNAIRRNKHAAPIVVYQHFNTAHTETGTRITNMDEELASFIHLMARDPNTWTIILSDHGHTRTKFGQTEDGLLERYNPLLFMIVPQNVAQLLGKKTMENLSTNQRRLLTTLDVHKALMTLHQESNTRSEDFRMSGVFSKIPSNRSCSDLPLMPLARCQCVGSEEMLKDNSPSHVWLAEFALGTLNGFIQQQYSKGEQSQSVGMKGYGRCTRMTGKTFTKVIQSHSGSLVKFNLHVDATSVGLHDDEVFQVAVKLQDGIPSLEFYDRQTKYNKFKSCADESVDIKLCICDRRKYSKDSVNYLDLKIISDRSIHLMFQSSANVTTLYKDCLFQITRSHPSGISVTYEVFNSCKDKTFQLEVKGTTVYYVFLSRTLPMVFTVEPNTVHFMFSGARQILNHSHLDISVSVTVIK